MTETFLNYTTVNPAVVDALVRANRVVARGFEQLAKQYIDTARQSFEDGVQIQRRLAGAANLSDFAALQSQVATESWQSALARSREWSDFGTTLARDVAACFNSANAEPEPPMKAQTQKKAA